MSVQPWSEKEGGCSVREALSGKRDAEAGRGRGRSVLHVRHPRQVEICPFFFFLSCLRDKATY